MASKLKIITGICLLAIILFSQSGNASPRNKRYSEGIEDPDSDSVADDEDYAIDEVDSNDLNERDERQTQPSKSSPFPEESNWWWDVEPEPEPEPEPETAPPYIPPTTSVYDKEITNSDPSYRNDDAEGVTEKVKFHKKIVPWFKRQWGHTKNFFNSLG